MSRSVFLEISLFLSRTNELTIISYKYIKKQTKKFILAQLKVYKGPKNADKVYGGPLKCSYSYLVGFRTFNVENQWSKCRGLGFGQGSSVFYVGIGLLKP